MTGFDSKRKVALEKLDDDDAQGYIAQFEEALQKEYQRGYDAGKASQPEQEPVASYLPEMSIPNFSARVALGAPDYIDLRNGWRPLYTTPAQRPWVGLTDEEMSEIAAQGHQRWKEHAQAIDAALRSKNT
jgi:hypothetical protein